MRARLSARVTSWLAAMRHRRAFEKQMADEMQFHVDCQTEKLIAQGVPPSEARRRPRLAFGSSNATAQERCRESYGLRVWDDLVADVRYALRQFRHAPGFTFTVIAVLALGIGANAAIFTVIDATLLRRLPYGHGAKIVKVTAADKSGTPQGWTRDEDVLAWGHAASIASVLYFRDAAGIIDGRPASLTDQHELLHASHSFVATNFCDFLETAPAIGRCFAAEDVKGGRSQALLISDAVWRGAFHADAQIVGRTLTLDKEPYTVIGVMQPDFAFPLPAQPVQVWSPVSMALSRDANDPDKSSFDALVRLHRGVSLRQGKEELSAIQYHQAAQRVAQTSLDIAQTQVMVRPLRATLFVEERPALIALLCAVFVLWLIACANVANLLLARGIGRQRELAVRAALGASRGRIVRQLLLESMLLSAAGSAAGVGIAAGVLIGFRAVLHRRFRMDLTGMLDLRVLAVLLGLTFLSAVIFGLAPALVAARVDTERSLRQKASTGAGRGHLRAQHTLVAAEVACTVVLLVACGLLLRTVLKLRAVPLGFRTENVAMVYPQVPEHPQQGMDMRATIYDPLLQRIRAIRGVRSAALTTEAPLSNKFNVNLALTFGDHEGPQENRRVSMLLHADGRDLQQVLGFRMVQGRFFNAQDRSTSAPVIVVNRAFAHLWQSSGKRLDEFTLSLGPDKQKSAHIIGVMDDMRQTAVGEPGQPEIDLCAEQLQPSDHFYSVTMAVHTEIAIRSSVPIATIAPEIRAAMAAVDPSLKGSVVETMQEVVNANIGDQLLAARLLEVFGGCALLVALTGLYGFLAYFVSQRTHDIGVRLALGARRHDIQFMFLSRAFGMIASGLGAGLLMSLLVTRLVQRFLYGVRPHDLATLAAVALLMSTAGLFAAWLPARRAAHVEPMEALREA